MPLNQNNHVDVPFFSRLIATGLFSGYSPIVPGTAGSLTGLAFYAIPGMEKTISLSLAIVATFFAGVYTSNQMEKKLGEDPPVVVIDEIVGMWIGLLAFFFFRIYDIIKPPPARKLEHLKNGWGIMLDDVAAGIYANITVRLLLFIFPGII